MSKHSALVGILQEAKKLLSRKDNDFSWSSWNDETEALKEIDDLLYKINANEISASPMETEKLCLI